MHYTRSSLSAPLLVWNSFQTDCGLTPTAKNHATRWHPSPALPLMRPAHQHGCCRGEQWVCYCKCYWVVSTWAPNITSTDVCNMQKKKAALLSLLVTPLCCPTDPVDAAPARGLSLFVSRLLGRLAHNARNHHALTFLRSDLDPAWLSARM